MVKQKLRVGSILEIPLSDGRKAYGRYLHNDKNLGQILQVYDYFLINDETIEWDELIKAKDLFEPIFVGISGAVRAGIWKVVGYLPIDRKIPTCFLQPVWEGDPPVVYSWYFWDGTKSVDLGSTLSEKYKKYEYIGGFAAPDITKRIETGEESFVKKLIAGEIKNTNK